MLANVPEPSTITILLAASIGVAFARRRGKCNRLLVIALCVLASSGLGGRLSAAPVDLTTFVAENFPPAATFPVPAWSITTSTASLNNNGDATVLLTPTNAVNKRIRGTLTPGTDDDVVGFVLGFEPGDSAIGATGEYILIDWKGANQNFNFNDPAGTTPEFQNLTGAGDMPVGLAISRVTGSANADELWTHTNAAASPTGGVQQLARGFTLGATPYNCAGGSHQFDIVYTENLVNVKVDGVEQFNLIGSFPAGRFGLYSAWQGPTATFADVDISDEFTISALAATVNRTDGTITINNPFTTPVAFDFYQFTSASNSLKNDTWLSLSDQNFQPAGAGAHQKWQEAGGSSPSAIAEVYLDGNSTLDPTTPSRSIGAAYSTSVNGEDLVFQYRLVSGELRTGFVQYIGTVPTLQGDYNTDGVVDAADYVVWRKTDGANPAGYNTWRTNFGRTSGAARRWPVRQACPSRQLAASFAWLCAWQRVFAVGCQNECLSAAESTGNPCLFVCSVDPVLLRWRALRRTSKMAAAEFLRGGERSRLAQFRCHLERYAIRGGSRCREAANFGDRSRWPRANTAERFRRQNEIGSGDRAYQAGNLSLGGDRSTRLLDPGRTEWQGAVGPQA